MAIREASPLGRSTLPAGGRVPWMCQESNPSEAPTNQMFGCIVR